MMQITLCFMIDELHILILIPHVFGRCPLNFHPWDRRPECFLYKSLRTSRFQKPPVPGSIVNFLRIYKFETGKRQFFGGGFPWFLGFLVYFSSLQGCIVHFMHMKFVATTKYVLPFQWGAMIHPGFMWCCEVYGAMIDALPQFVQ